MKQIKVGVVVGSLRRDSYSKKIAQELVNSAPENLSFEFLEIDNLPLYNEEYDAEAPKAYTEFRQKVKSVDALLFVTPEYNRSIPGVLKNAIDIASRPWGQNAWNEKPAAIVSVTMGSLGAFGANHHLRQTLAFLNMPVMGQPEAYISSAATLFDESGKLTDQSTKDFLIAFMQAFNTFSDKNL